MLNATLRPALAAAGLLTLIAAAPAAEPAAAGAVAWPTAGWRVSTPEEQGMDSFALAELVAFGAARQFDSLLVARHGVIVLEVFYAPFRAGAKHRVYSVTKSVVGTLAAIALGDKRLASTNERVADIFAGRPIANLDARKTAITIQNLLDMRSGLAWSEGGGTPSSVLGMTQSDDWAQFVLDQPMDTSPGAVFNYSNGDAHLVSAILARATGEPVKDYARERLFAPLGISDIFWQEDPQGVAIGGFGLFLQPRDMAKLGYLYLRGGVWDGVRIVPAEWIERIRHGSVATGAGNLHYTNFFWVDPRQGAYFATGYHGQQIYVMPDQDIVAAVTASGSDAPSDVEIALIARAVKADSALPADPYAQSLLAGQVRIAASETPTPAAETPPIARAISGKTYRFPDNALRLESLRLSLDGPDPSFAYVLKPDRPGAPPERFEGPLGLEGVYRTGAPKPDGTLPAARGRWDGERAFILEFEDMGGDDRRVAELAFKDNSVEVTSGAGRGRTATATGTAE